MKKKFDWTAYNKVRKNNPARETLLFALMKFSEENIKSGLAYDIGCGPGNDTRELLSAGWKVAATDSNPGILNYYSPLLKKYGAKLEIQISSFEDIKWKMCDLVNASFTLPFCSNEHFGFLMKNIFKHIKKGGRFSGQFFGRNDEWKDLIRHSRSDVIQMFKGFEFDMFGEIEKNDRTTMGELKHWHIFNIVAKKK